MPRTVGGKYLTKSAQTFQDGDNFWQAGKFEEAKKTYIEAAKLYDKDDDVEGEAFVLSRLGELELSLNNYEGAKKALLAATELVKDFEDGQNTYGEALIKLSKVYTAEIELDEALETLAKAKEVLEAIGNRDLLGDAYDHEAYVFLMKNNDEKALKAYKKSAELYHKEAITLKEASTMRAIARILMKNKKYEEAHNVLEVCRNLYRENGDLLGEASTLSAIGSLRYIIHDIENARKALMKSVYLYGKVAHHYAEAEALLYLARVESFDKERGDFERAKAHYKRSIELFDFLDNDTMKNAVTEEYYNFMNRMM